MIRNAIPRLVLRRPAARREAAVEHSAPPAADAEGVQSESIAHLRAIEDEGWSEIVALQDDVRRKHMHWVHVRTHNNDQ